MTEPHLTTVLEEAEHVAEQHDQVARTTENQAHKYLRYAVFRVLEGEADLLPADWTPIDGVTVGYGRDEAMFDSWGSSEDWLETVPPQEACTRFRVFFPDDHQTVPRDIVDVMAALGAWRVWTGSAATCGSYDHRERREVHYLWPEGHPVEEVLHERLSGPAEAVAPDGGRTGDVRDRLVVNENAQSQNDLEPRTKRAVAEAMDVSLLSKVAATRCIPRPATGTKSTSSTNRVPVPTGSSAHPKAAASTCVASITRSSAGVFRDPTDGSQRPSSSS